jgi:hypothetical protein
MPPEVKLFYSKLRSACRVVNTHTHIYTQISINMGLVKNTTVKPGMVVHSYNATYSRDGNRTIAVEARASKNQQEPIS